MDQLSIQSIPKHGQGLLFDVEYGGNIKSPGQARTSSGARIEHFVCEVLGITQIPLRSSYNVNFDAGLYINGKPTFFEIKSLRIGGKSPLYVWRLDKEAQAQKQIGRPVIYIFCMHSIKGAKTQEEITYGLTHKKVKICLATLNEVKKWTKTLPINTVKTKGQTNGYSRKGYDQGYVNLPQKKIASSCINTFQKTVSVLKHEMKLDLCFSPKIPDQIKSQLSIGG